MSFGTLDFSGFFFQWVLGRSVFWRWLQFSGMVMSYLQTTNWASAALLWLQVSWWKSQHCHAPSKTWVFCFTDLHLIRQEGKKKNPGPWGSWRKGPLCGRSRQMLWRAAACGTAGLQPNTTFEELSKNPLCTRMGELSSVCLPQCDVWRCLCSPKTPRIQAWANVHPDECWKSSGLQFTFCM